MIECATRLAPDRTWVYAVPFFENKIADFEAYKAVNGNTLGNNGFSSAYALTEIAGELKSVYNKMKSRQDNELTQ